MDKYSGERKRSAEILPSDVKSKTLELGVPARTTKEQWDVINIFIEKLLKNPSTIKTELSRGGIEYRLPNGQGVRYNKNDSFSGFLDPKRGNNS